MKEDPKFEACWKLVVGWFCVKASTLPDAKKANHWEFASYTWDLWMAWA